MSNVELKLKNTINDNDIYDIYIDNVYAGGLEANYDPRINSFYIENIKKSDSYKAGHLLEDVVNYLYNDKGYNLGCLPLEKYRGYYEELGFTPFIHNGDDIFYHKIHGRNAMKSDEFLTSLKNIINEDLNEGRNLIPNIIEKYGDLTIPEFIDELIKKEENGENILNESLNENIYRTYHPSRKATELLISLIKTKYKYIKVTAYSPKSENYGYLDIDSNTGKQELHGAITAEFLDKSEQTASWVVSWGSHSVGSSTRQKSLFNACAKAFPDYVDKPSSSYSWDNVTFYTETTLGRKTDSGEREAIKDLANQLNNIISKIDDIMGQESINADKELEEIEKARIQAKQNQTAQKTTVKQALSKSAIAKKIMSLQNPTPEQLAKILAAIE